MELFDVIDVMFTNHAKWVDVTNYDKKKHYFMINRMMSIQYPLQANALQHLKTNQIGVVEFWFNFISSNYNYKPKWLYTKAKKNEKAKKAKVSNESIMTYAKLYGYETKNVKKAIDIFGDEVVDDIKKLEKNYKN